MPTATMRELPTKDAGLLGLRRFAIPEVCRAFDKNMQRFLEKDAGVFRKTCRAFWLTLIFNFGNMQENRGSVRGAGFGERWAFWEKPCVASGDGLGGSWNRVGWIRCPACFGCIWGGRPVFFGLLRGRLFSGIYLFFAGYKNSVCSARNVLSRGIRWLQTEAVFLCTGCFSAYRGLRNSGFPCR